MKPSGRKTVKGRTTSAPKISKTPAPEAVVVTASTIEGNAPPTHEAIAQRAYEIYLERGGQPGHQTEDWVTAERELSA
jgi:hypothetical protein